MSKQFEPPPAISGELRRRFPGVDWGRVQFFAGLPWWVTPGTAGITLPDPLGRRGVRIHLGPDAGAWRAADRSTVMHEAVHVAQFMARGGGRGLGWFRPGFVAYVAAHLAHGYGANPFETEAYGFQQAPDDAIFVETGAPLDISAWWLIAAPAVAVMALLAALAEAFEPRRA